MLIMWDKNQILKNNNSGNKESLLWLTYNKQFLVYWTQNTVSVLVYDGQSVNVIHKYVVLIFTQSIGCKNISFYYKNTKKLNQTFIYTIEQMEINSNYL